MSVYAIYFSPVKGTEKVVTCIANEFGRFINIDLSEREAVLDYHFHEDDLCIVGVPSYGGRVPAIALERMKNFKGNHVPTILTAVYGNRAYEDTLIELYDFLNARDFECVAAISAIAQHSIMHQFGAHRPDEDDQAQLADFAKQIQNKLKGMCYQPLELPGNHPYKEYKGVPLKPSVSKQCTECGVCAEHCPVGAIPVDTPNKTVSSLCISCMRCIDICPAKARSLNPLKLKVASAKLKKSCALRKENELFL